MDSRDPLTPELERHPGARGFVRSGTVELQLSRSEELPLMLVDLVGRHPAAARDGVGRGRHLEPRPEIDDRDVLARVEPALKRFRRDAGDAKRPEKEPPAHVLYQDVA